MLSRSAANLYWMGRYVERADFLARLIEATGRLAALPSTYGGDPTAWSGALAASGMAWSFAQEHGEPDETSVVAFLANEPENPSAIRNCLERARNNGRAVRTALTVEAWEALNGAWHEAQRFGTKPLSKPRAGELIEVVRRSVLAFEGALHRTMLRGDALCFLELGAAVERADNTARLIDVKYHLLLPKDETVGGSLDYFQWATLLRTVSALTAYHWVYRGGLKPWLVADLLIFNTQMPRSLLCAYGQIVEILDQLSRGSGRRGPADRTAAATLASLRGSDIDEVFASGLHEFIGGFIRGNNRLGEAVAQQFLF
jgi:uncharacterized alpha-E superfamily protein